MTIDETENDWKPKLLTAESPRVFNARTDAADWSERAFTFQDGWLPSSNTDKESNLTSPSPFPRSHPALSCTQGCSFFNPLPVLCRESGWGGKQIQPTGTCGRPEGVFVVWICNRKALAQDTWR